MTLNFDESPAADRIVCRSTPPAWKRRRRAAGRCCATSATPCTKSRCRGTTARGRRSPCRGRAATGCSPAGRRSKSGPRAQGLRVLQPRCRPTWTWKPCARPIPTLPRPTSRPDAGQRRGDPPRRVPPRARRSPVGRATGTGLRRRGAAPGADADDSPLSWGLPSTIFEHKEVISPWVLEQRRRRDPAVAAESRQALTDPKLAADPQARYMGGSGHTPGGTTPLAWSRSPRSAWSRRRNPGSPDPGARLPRPNRPRAQAGTSAGSNCASRASALPIDPGLERRPLNRRPHRRRRRAPCQLRAQCLGDGIGRRPGGVQPEQTVAVCRAPPACRHATAGRRRSARCGPRARRGGGRPPGRRPYRPGSSHHAATRGQHYRPSGSRAGAGIGAQRAQHVVLADLHEDKVTREVGDATRVGVGKLHLCGGCDIHEGS